MTSDPRLMNVSLLTLAAMRAHKRRQVAPAQSWAHTEGLHALLQTARQQALPPRDLWTLPDLDPCDGLSRLLAEARQWQEEREHGA